MPAHIFHKRHRLPPPNPSAEPRPDSGSGGAILAVVAGGAAWALVSLAIALSTRIYDSLGPIIGLMLAGNLTIAVVVGLVAGRQRFVPTLVLAVLGNGVYALWPLVGCALAPEQAQWGLSLGMAAFIFLVGTGLALLLGKVYDALRPYQPS